MHIHVKQLNEQPSHSYLSDKGVNKNTEFIEIRNELFDKYGIAKHNDGLSEIEEIMSKWTDVMKTEGSEEELNAILIWHANRFKQKDADNLNFEESVCFVKFFSQLLQVDLSDD